MTEPKDLPPNEKTRANHIVDRVMALDENAAAGQLADVLENFQGRHLNLIATFEARADEMEDAFAGHAQFSRTQRQLVGAYFLNEYSFEASALFNPSIVAHPDQSLAPEGGLQFIVSLRAVGEGHVSSLTFRAGTITKDGSVTIDPTVRLAATPRIVSTVEWPGDGPSEVQFTSGRDISERVIFPVTAAQSNGIEDARFVAFEDDGKRTFLATYTAYDGRAIRSELIETQDFLTFRMTPLRGSAARNKGMALFPRKLHGRYAMIGRQDNENLYLIYSDDLHVWEGGQPLLSLNFPGSSCRSGIAVRRSNSTRVGCCSPTAWAPCADTRSVRRFSIRTIRQRSSPAPTSRWYGPTLHSARDMFPTSYTRVAPSGTVNGSCSLMRCQTPSRTLRRSGYRPSLTR